MQHRESDLQIICFYFFRKQYPQFANLFFAVPNGGKRSIREAARMKKEGVLAGVADALLLLPCKAYHGLCIEFKTKDGKQSKYQKAFQSEVENQGYKYEIVRSFEDFMFCIKNYFSYF